MTIGRPQLVLIVFAVASWLGAIQALGAATAEERSDGSEYVLDIDGDLALR